jgi:hypothetical protein
MQTILTKSIECGRIEIGTAQTLKALITRGFCDSDGEINPFGRVTAISLLPLAEQCRVLRIPLVVHLHAWHGRPEQAALSLLPDKPRWAFLDEGRMLHALIHALVLPRLYSLASGAWNGNAGYDRARSWLYRHYAAYHEMLEIDPQLTQGMLQDIHRWDRTAFATSWQTLATWNLLLGSHPAVDVGSDEALAVLDCVGEPTLSAIAARVFSEPFAYYHGWPDLMLLDSTEKLRFVEVKTTDRLHFGQIVTMNDMRETAGLNISVMRLQRPSQRFVRNETT